MRSFVAVAALLGNALPSLAHGHGHAHAELHRVQPRREDESHDADQLRKREIYARNQDAADNNLATNWIDEGWEGSQYVDDCLRNHNYHRMNHLAFDVTWSPQLAYTAQLVASSCVYEHDTSYDGGLAGQNIAAGLPANNVSGCITDLWYNSEAPYFTYYYGQAQPDYSFFINWAHMTQVVWHGTTEIGCATQFCPYGLANAGGIEPYFTVCNYREAGNVEGMYDQNVFAPQGMPEIHWDSYYY